MTLIRVFVIRGVTDKLYNYAKSVLGVSPYFDHFNLAGKSINCMQSKPELSYTKVEIHVLIQAVPLINTNHQSSEFLLDGCHEQSVTHIRESR
jgi:hypothetical protein